MRPIGSYPSPTSAILLLAEIKAAVEGFEQGDSNVFDALVAIVEAIEAARAAASPEPHRDAA